MLETGHPLHAFDADKIEGGRIIVRRAKNGEKIRALDGKTYALDPEILVIADHNKPVAIAGIMGGEETAVHAGTRSVLLESAIFERTLIRRARKKLGLSSESSYRFERGVTTWSLQAGSARAETLITQDAGGEIKAFSHAMSKPDGKQKSSIVSLRASLLEKILGEKISSSEIAEIFQMLGIPLLSFDPE